MMELLLFLCLLISVLLLCLMLVAALTVCLLLGNVMLLQKYRILIQQNDANRYTQHVYACHMQFTTTVGVTMCYMHLWLKQSQSG